MGSQCLATTPNQKYNRFIEKIDISELKDLWQTVKVYKIKDIFEEASEPNPHYPSHIHLPYHKFKELFPQFEKYPEQQIQRLFEFFDFDSKGFVDWNCFFSAITICYFGSERDLAVLMFMMFDHALELKLDAPYEQLMIESNEGFLRPNSEDVVPDYEDVLAELRKKQCFKVDNWLEVAEKHFDFSSFRKIFNIFAQEKMEKQLVKNFVAWNIIFNEEKEKYIGYLIDLKWFQSWKMYIFHHYNVNIQVYGSVLETINTIRTCKKTAMTIKGTKKTLIDTNKDPHGCRLMAIQRDKSKESYLKDIDCIHGHLGERPREITNGELEGELQEMLRNNMSQNMDYVIVSEQVWNYLKDIYGGYPEFRRTGFDSLELYPKIACVYFSLFKGTIDYSSEVLREVSSYLSVEQMLTKSCDISAQDLEDKVIFYKTIGMKKWQLIEDPSYLFTELTSDILLYMVCLPKDQKETFIKSHQKHPQDVTEVNLGDNLIFTDEKGQEKTVVFMGKNVEGKYILHFQQESYTNDMCLLESQLLKKCKLTSEINQIEPEKKIQSGLVGLPSGPNLGFINTVLLQLFNHKDTKKILKMVDDSRDDKFFYCLAKVSNIISKQCKVESSDIKLIVELFFQNYCDFEVTMCLSSLKDILNNLSNEFKEEKIHNSIEQNLELELQRTVKCHNCKEVSTTKEKSFVYNVFLPEEEHFYMEVVWIPSYSYSSDILRYVVKVKKTATLAQLMKAFEEQLGHSRPYVLAEVHGHDIVKNYNFANKNTTLQNLTIRESDKLFAFELINNFNNFVSTHFSSNDYIDEDELKTDMIIDCNHEDKGWIFGRIIEIDFLPYTHTSFVRVNHKFNKNQSWEITYSCFEDSIARFPLKSHKNSELYHIRIQQRCFNEAANSMQLVNIPLVIAIPSWMRWKEFFFLIYLQIGRFIAEKYRFQGDKEPSNAKSSKKLKSSQAIDKFKEYKSSSKFPYSLRLVDYEGRCIVCMKFLKTTVFKGQHENYCEGCELSQSEPISWQVKPADLMICVDWRGSDRYKRDFIEVSESAKNRIQEMHSNEELSLSSCLNRVENEYMTNYEYLCCNKFSAKTVKDKFIKTSNTLVFYIERILQQSDGFKKVVNRRVKLVLQGLVVDKKKYNLVGLTSIEGQNYNIRYKTYVLKEKGQWYQYDGQLVKIVDTKQIQRQCALVLYYQKTSA